MFGGLDRILLTSRRGRYSLAAGAVCLGLATAAHAEPKALVLDHSDDVTFPAFTELQPGDEIQLGKSGHVDLLDYSACREVRITSGEVKVTGTGLEVKGGEETELRAGNCMGQAQTLSQGAGQGTDAAASGETAGTSDGAMGNAQMSVAQHADESKVATSVMLRFGEDARAKYDSVAVSVDGKPAQVNKVQDFVLNDVTPHADGSPVPVTVYLKGAGNDGAVVARQYYVDANTLAGMAAKVDADHAGETVGLSEGAAEAVQAGLKADANDGAGDSNNSGASEAADTAAQAFASDGSDNTAAVTSSKSDGAATTVTSSTTSSEALPAKAKKSGATGLISMGKHMLGLGKSEKVEKTVKVQKTSGETVANGQNGSNSDELASGQAHSTAILEVK